jgi:hypothetical protein
MAVLLPSSSTSTPTTPTTPTTTLEGLLTLTTLQLCPSNTEIPITNSTPI